MTQQVPRRTLGTEGLSVSAIGFGCMGMSHFYGLSEDEASLRVLHHALDIGIDFLDTADMYGMGDNERLIARLLKARRGEVVLATKFGVLRGADGSFRGVDGRPEYVLEACDASLERLGVDHIDLYYQHRVDPRVPIEETVGAMAELVRAGKVRYLGLSEAAGDTLRRAVNVHPIAALQSEYSLWSRSVEEDSLAVCRELGVGFVAYSPLGRGFLTGTITDAGALDAGDFRRHSPRFQPDNAAVNRALVDAVTALARERGCTPAQLALAWLLHRDASIVPIPGTRRIERLDENAAAARVSLTAGDLDLIDHELALHEVAGARYPEAQMAQVNL